MQNALSSLTARLLPKFARCTCHNHTPPHPHLADYTILDLLQACGEDNSASVARLPLLPLLPICTRFAPKKRDFFLIFFCLTSPALHSFIMCASTVRRRSKARRTARPRSTRCSRSYPATRCRNGTRAATPRPTSRTAARSGPATTTSSTTRTPRAPCKCERARAFAVQCGLFLPEDCFGDIQVPKVGTH